LHSLWSRRSRSALLSSDELRWCLILTEPFFLAGSPVLAALLSLDLLRACAGLGAAARHKASPEQSSMKSGRAV